MQRHHGHQTGRERRLTRAPPGADQIDEQHRRRAEQRRDGAAPEIEIRGLDLIERGPFAGGGAADEAEARDRELDVEVTGGVVEEMRIEVTGPHHADGALHDLRFVDADVERNARADADEPQQGGQQQDQHQGDDRLVQVDCFAPLPFSHRPLSSFSGRIEYATLAHGSPARSHLPSRAAAFLVDWPPGVRAAAVGGSRCRPLRSPRPRLRLRHRRQPGAARRVRPRLWVRSVLARPRAGEAVRPASPRPRLDDRHPVRRRHLRSGHRVRRPLQPERAGRGGRCRRDVPRPQAGRHAHRQRRGARRSCAATTRCSARKCGARRADGCAGS